MITFERPVRFEEVDAAGIVFFARYLSYAHDAMEHFFGGIEGGYVDLITRRKIGFPAVNVTCDYHAPLRYGDVAIIAIDVAKIGTTSCTFRYRMTRKSDGVASTTVLHTIVTSDIETVVKMPIPADVRALLEAHHLER